MILLGGGNYRGFFEKEYNVFYYPIIDVYSKDIEFYDTDDFVVFMGSMNLTSRYNPKNRDIHNTYLQSNLLKLRDKKFVFVSSSAVYGLCAGKGGFSVDSPLLGESEYAQEKIEIETLLTTLLDRVIILRPSGFFGSTFGFKPKSFLNSLSESVFTGLHQSYDVEFAGRQLRDFTYVDDLFCCINYFCKSNLSGSERHNVSSTMPVPIKDITKKVANSHTNIHFNYLESDEEKIHSWLQNSPKMQEILPTKRDISQFLGLN